MADRLLRIKLVADITNYRSEMERASKLCDDYNKSAQTSSKKLTSYLDQNSTTFIESNKNNLSAYSEQKKRLDDLIACTKLQTQYDDITCQPVNGDSKNTDPAAQKSAEELAKDKEEKINKGSTLADQVIYDQKSQLEKINIDEEAKLNILDQWRETGLADEQKYQDARTAIVNDANKKRMQLEVAAMQSGLSSASDTCAKMAELILKHSDESSSAYKTMFALSKGFAVANASLNLSVAISQAMADQSAMTPAQKFANWAAVAAAGGALISQMESIKYGGGRENGGSVISGSLYEVGENNLPEIFKSGNRQYMIPGNNGRVFSNNDVISSNSSSNFDWTFIVENNASNTEVQQPSIDQEKRIVRLAVNEVADSVRQKRGDVWSALSSTTNVISKLR